ncbi:MAG: DUF3224 domain-containing protein [Gemmatimonadetes bacterium]|nr:DUF3224 domain-containing protein [Gemmatimonadota bacterium]
MGRRIVSAFEVTGWEETPYGEEGEGPSLGEALVLKSYTGELEGVGRARLLMCRADPASNSENAGYVASERVEGRLAGKRGTFVLQHWGVVADGTPPRTAGHVVPGSGTDELAGLTGTMEIAVAEDGTHTLALDYELD